MPDRITVVGVPGNEVPPGAALYVGGRRQLATWAPPGAASVVLGGDVAGALDAVAAADGVVCVLASGDPGFFGIVRGLAERFGADALDIRPAPSSVSLAFARLGLAWDDALVVSAHGRPLAEAAQLVGRTGKAAVLVSPESPPEALGKELLARRASFARAAVCSRLGLDGESVTRTDLAGLASGTWDPLSVVVLWDADTGPKSLAWGLPDSRFEHRAGMVTKAEVRAVALGKLDLPSTGVLWDVGAGSGSVAIECARLAPALRVFAVERRTDDAQRIASNAAALGLGAAVSVRVGDAPGVLAALPDPDRAFVGGGGIEVLDAVLARVGRGGTVVATYAALDRAAAAAERLGSLTQVSISRGERLPDGSFRLAAENPVFVVWGVVR